MTAEKTPVTILTGFLGSGKTTLLNRILSEQHGLRIAVIENEYGEIGIDQGLVIDADEEVFEMSNGCICCTVRGDLIRILGGLAKRRDRFDYVLVETTGLADPGPVAQTFFMDEDVREHYALDGIVTLVDARHLEQQLGHGRECAEQVAFADVLVLNKTDLVDAAALPDLETRLRGMNALARIHRASHAGLPIERVLNLSAFDLDRALERKPSFLEPEYPFEWTGVWHLRPGATLELGPGPDPSMSLVVLPLPDPDDGRDAARLRDGAERCVRLYAEPATDVAPGDILPPERHLRLALDAPGRKRFVLDLPAPGRVALYAQHRADEFDLLVRDAQGAPQAPAIDHAWSAQHEHDDSVTSVGIELPGDLDPDRLERWLSALLREQGADIFRMKGFLSLAGEAERFVFQGVHMLFDGRPHGPWGDAPRGNQLVFIGRNLDRVGLEAGLQACLA
jgi:G3E family GTPase